MSYGSPFSLLDLQHTLLFWYIGFVDPFTVRTFNLGGVAVFIVLEGPDGCGKSTLVDVLSEQVNGVVYATPPKSFLEKREKIDRHALPYDSYQFYLAGLHEASDDISRLMAQGLTVVCDRYWLSTYTYHKLLGVECDIQDFSTLLQPDLTVLLNLNHRVQRDRMVERGLSALDVKFFEHQQQIGIEFYQNALEFNVPFVAIDTQRFSPEQCARIVSAAT